MSIKKSIGNMYEWVSHVWSPIIGCSHQCNYCYVKKYKDLPETPKLELPWHNLGENRTIFVGHMCDMFSANVPEDWIKAVFYFCKMFPKNKYVFQTKNPCRLADMLDKDPTCLPSNSIIGTTIETNRASDISLISRAPSPQDRSLAFSRLPENQQRFVTIEPVMDFDPDEFIKILIQARPNFINIGADSKGHNLVEPTKEKIETLVKMIQENKIEIRKKLNLERLGFIIT